MRVPGRLLTTELTPAPGTGSSALSASDHPGGYGASPDFRPVARNAANRLALSRSLSGTCRAARPCVGRLSSSRRRAVRDEVADGRVAGEPLKISEIGCR